MTTARVLCITGKNILSGIAGIAQLLLVLSWPILKWLLSIEVFFQFIRMLYHWNTPDMHSGWTFAIHFAFLVALNCIVSTYRPK